MGEDFLEPDWIPYVHLRDSPRLRSATNQKVDILGTILLYVRLGENSDE